MKSLSRISRFVRPHRRKLVVSVVFALLVAVLWSFSLLLAFPVIKVLGQNQSLAEYINEEITESKQNFEEHTRVVTRLENERQSLSNKESQDYIALRRRQAHHQNKASAAEWRLFLFQSIHNRVLPLVPKDKFDSLALIFGLLLVVTVLKGICRFVQETLIGSIVELTVMGLRKECFRHSLKLDYQTLALEGTPKLMSRFTYDMQLIADGLTLVGVKVVREPLKALACIVCALFVNWPLTVLSLLFLLPVGLIFYRFGRIVKKASQRLMESMSRIYQVLEETFDGLKVVIAFNGARRHRRRFHHENKQYYRKAMQIVKIDALSSPLTETLGMFAIFLAILPGAYLVLRHTTSIWNIRFATDTMDIAELAVMYTLMTGIIDPARKLSAVYTRLKRATAATSRVFDFMDRESAVRQPPEPLALSAHNTSIEFASVSFQYASQEDNRAILRTVLDDVNLKVDAGEVIAVVGENGSGKSTLVHLLPRFFDPQRGTVLIDGIDIRDVSLRDLRGHIGIVTQETLLFDDTIYENVRYGKPGAPRVEVEEAARKAHMMPWVEQLPDGFSTRVGEKGRRLSGGQRQRLALARAILRDPAILILDEATSAVDAQSQLLMHQVLRSFVKGRTTFLITHSVSPSLLELITRIVVMDRGKLVAVGSHDRLLETCPIYQRLFEAQNHGKAA